MTFSILYTHVIFIQEKETTFSEGRNVGNVKNEEIKMVVFLSAGNEKKKSKTCNSYYHFCCNNRGNGILVNLFLISLDIGRD